MDNGLYWMNSHFLTDYTQRPGRALTSKRTVMIKNTLTGITIAILTSAAHAAPPIRTTTDVALSDFKQGKPISGLPDIKKPIYIMPKVLVCGSAGALANPNIQVLLLTEACIFTKVKMRVNVRIPRDAQQYIQNYVYSTIQVSWDAGEVSSRSVESGWVYLDGLAN
jgi:hypothetical protein